MSVLEATDYNIRVYGNWHTPRGKSAKTWLETVRNVGAVIDCNTMRSNARHLRGVQTIQVEEPVAGMIFISAQEELVMNGDLYFTFLNTLQPRSVLAINHRIVKERLFPMLQVAAAWPTTRLLSLSPDTLQQMHTVLKTPPLSERSDWILPVVPYHQEGPQKAASQMGGVFIVQGKIEQERRDYVGLIADISAHEAEVKEAGLQVKLVGALTSSSPVIPEELKDVVSIHGNLAFEGFYETISDAIALLPVPASSTYITGAKITSSMVTALITGVPLLATKSFQASYEFVPPEAFYLHEEDQTMAEAMLAVMRLSDEEHQAVRTALRVARDALTARNLKQLKFWLKNPPGLELYSRV